jgi:hypothetical protein
MRRILLAALLGGIAVFVWGMISHMLLPLGEAGVKMLPDEAGVTSALGASIHEPGVYLFPGVDMKDSSKEAQQRWAEKYKKGPTGMLIYHPVGEEFKWGPHLAIEFLSNLLGALVAAILLARVAGGYGSRVLLTAALGLFAWLAINISYWDWYGFPANFVLLEGVDQVISWLAAGLVIAKVVRPPASAT